jgi:signal transduction histidine kinase
MKSIFSGRKSQQIDDQEDGYPKVFGLEIAQRLSLCVAEAKTPSDALEAIAGMVKNWMLFDQLAVFVKRLDGMLEPAFARSIKQSPSHETDESWGDTMARKAIDGGKSLVYEGQKAASNKGARETLSVPLKLNEKMIGALVIIRYHGPAFREEEVQLGNFLGSQVIQIINSQELADRLADLEAKRYLSALQDEFIAMISHELLTPLGFIKGYATTLMRDDVEWDKGSQREFLTIIDDETDRLRKIIEDLLDSSRLRAGTLPMNLQPVKLESFIQDIVIRAKTRDEKLDLFLETVDRGMRVMADATRLAQVMDNLFSNASKYAPQTPVKIIVSRENDNAKITFSDSGPGIAPEHIAGLFQRFFRVPELSNNTRGTGLGLYICKHIIEAHKGEITVSSVVGQGTTFSVLLPLLDQKEDTKK